MTAMLITIYKINIILSNNWMRLINIIMKKKLGSDNSHNCVCIVKKSEEHLHTFQDFVVIL